MKTKLLQLLTNIKAEGVITGQFSPGMGIQIHGFGAPTRDRQGYVAGAGAGGADHQPGPGVPSLPPAEAGGSKTYPRPVPGPGVKKNFLTQARTVLWGIEESSPPPHWPKSWGIPPIGSPKEIFLLRFPLSKNFCGAFGA